jgi:predicted transcriptional regulator
MCAVACQAVFLKGRPDLYGTILIDQLLHKVVDVLPDREAETFAKWLEKHPGVEVISRDRAGNYADGARRGAPQAIQVCDRFHLLMNLQTALTRLFERKHDPLKRLAEAQEQEAVPTEIPVPSEPTTSPDPKPLTRTAVEAQARRIRRKERYEQVLRLHEQGASQVAIAALVGLDRDTVRRYLRAPAFPEIVRPGRHQSKLDPYKDYLHQRMQEGQRNATHLVADLREQGYRGGSTIVRDYLRSGRSADNLPGARHTTRRNRQGASPARISFPPVRQPGCLSAIPASSSYDKCGSSTPCAGLRRN